MKFSFSLCSITASIFLSALFSGQDANAQLKLGGNPGIVRGDALLELETNRKGMLLPRVAASALTQHPLDTAASGMMIYNVTDNKVYIRSSGLWKPVSDAASTGWNLTGNATINPATNFLGTTDARPLIFKTNAIEFARITETGKLGVGTNAPHSNLHVNGSTATNVALATGNFTMADSNSVVIFNNSDNANFALQSPASFKGRAIEVIAYGTDSIFFTGYAVRSQQSTNPTVALAPGYTLRLVSDGTSWVVSGKQRSGLPLYYATNTGTGEGEVLRDYNGYINHGSGVFQTDVQEAPLNPIPNEGAWFSMMLQTVGGGYFGQFNLNDHNAYFRGNEVSKLGISVWQKFFSHPATIQFSGERVGTDSLNFNMTNNRNVVFSTNNTARVRITGDGTTRLHTAVATNIKLVTTTPYNVDPTDYTIVARVTGGGSNPDIVINLPDASTIPGRILVIRGLVQGTGAAPDVIIRPASGDSINMTTGDLPFQASNSRTGNTFFILQALDDNNWVIISR